MTDDRTAASDTAEPAAVMLAHEIRRLRRDAGLSQPQLAQKIGYTRQYVSLAERVGRNLPSQELVRALDAALKAGGSLLALRTRAKAEQHARRTGLTVPAPTTPTQKIIDGPNDSPVEAPPGRFFAGSIIPARRIPAVDDGRILAAVPADFTRDPFLLRPRRGLLIGVTQSVEGTRHFGLDTRRARTRLAHAVDEAPLLIPRAYELDDLTLGILWAVANLDDALLDDDTALVFCGARLNAYENQRRSAGGRDLAADLATVSQMWLGSHFCARHILRHADALTDTPSFWTREQRGEEASTWLLFAHKYDYLRQSVAMFNGGGRKPTRSFCIPRATVTDSATPERILLLLAIALIESLGIQVEVCAEPEYTGTQGFALDQRRRAIVANWVGTEGIWQVDVTDSRPTLREFADATGYAHAHSVLAAPDPAARLRTMADYLGLDWHWLVRRCAELGEYGCAGLAQPRSRLLSLTGLDQALCYVGEIGRAGR